MTKKLKLTLVVVALMITTLFGTALYADENENITKDTKTTTIPDFIDVPKDFWGYADIMEMVQMGYLKGKGDGRFDPNGQVTYAEFLTMIANMFYEVETYPNITNKPWYYDNVRWVNERGIGKYWGQEFGEGENYFSGGMSLNSMDGAEYIKNTKAVMPHYNYPIKRHSMALAMYDIAFNSIGQVRSLPKPDVKLYEHEGARGRLVKEFGTDQWYYNHHNKTHNFVQVAIDYNYKHGFLRGINAKGDFGGHRYMTRAEAAAVLKRLYHASVEREQPTAFKDILVEKHDVNRFGNKRAYYDILAVYRPNKLTNGKSDTPENRVELLKEIMLSMPHGKEWANKNYPDLEYAIMNDTIGWQDNGCNGYAVFITTALFGQFAPLRVHHDIYNSQIGDVWDDIGLDDVQYHYEVVIEKYQPSDEDKQYMTEEELKQSSEGVYRTTSGNSGGRVSWGWHEMLAPQALAYMFPKSNIYTLDTRTY